MSSPGPSSGTNKPAELFEELWRQLGECHQNALQELEVKVSKLKKERCLDAQRLEVFYNRNQQLKEQNKSLQDTISLLEERLRAGECDQCAIIEENQKNNQDQNLRLIAKLKNERNSLEDENRKLQAELQRLKMSHSEPQQASPSDQDEGIIPDSPVLSSSLPAANKLKKRKNLDKIRHIRYAELPLPQCNNSLFSELNKEPRRAEVLVPNTCELDSSQTSNDVNHDVEEVIAETCGLELVNKHHLVQKTTTTAGQRCLNPDLTTERSPSLPPRVKRFPEDDFSNNAKRKKDSEPQEQESNKHSSQEGVDTQKEVKHTQPQPIKRTSSFMKQVQSAQSGTSSQRPSASCASPASKKLKDKVKGEGDHAGQKSNPLQDLNVSQDQHETEDAGRKHRTEPMWSIDPALVLSMYDSEQRGDQEEEEEEEPCHGELADTDCTWVSHSLLQARGENGCSRRDNVSGLGVKANDSLDMMFDTTAYGEYNSYNNSHIGQSQPCDDDDDEEEEEEKEEEEEEEEDSEQDRPGSTSGPRKAQHPTFAHVAIIRKKDERRKLKGTTCKECETYYAHLPEEEKQKKLSSCSRHRFLYIPPCTPENFWEVGFPSTQTCIERGYIREEKNPQVRLRRRQPLTALFSPKPEEN